MDEHQLFETALAATMNELDLAFNGRRVNLYIWAPALPGELPKHPLFQNLTK